MDRCKCVNKSGVLALIAAPCLRCFGESDGPHHISNMSGSSSVADLIDLVPFELVDDRICKCCCAVPEEMTKAAEVRKRTGIDLSWKLAKPTRVDDDGRQVEGGQIMPLLIGIQESNTKYRHMWLRVLDRLALSFSVVEKSENFPASWGAA